MQGHYVEVSNTLDNCGMRLTFTSKYIVLVGEFGESPYLRNELQRQFCERAELLSANDPEWVLPKS
jgi:hypothetical protein